MKIAVDSDVECRVLGRDGDLRTVLIPADVYHVHGSQGVDYRIRYDPDGSGTLDVLVKFGDAREI